MAGFNHWPQIAAALKPGVQRAVTNTAKAIRGLASDGAPKLSGWMADNVYTVTPLEGSTYGQAGAPPGPSSAYLLPEQTPPDDMSAVVGAAANYSVYVEEGHHTTNGGYVPANPWFFPAVEQGRGILDAELKAVSSELEGSVSGMAVLGGATL